MSPHGVVGVAGAAANMWWCGVSKLCGWLAGALL
jgi:hypothetical protein